jgi:hypothetical protein
MLSKAGNARAAFLELVKSGLESPPKYVCASKNIGFSAALAAGDIETARRIASSSPQSHFGDIEYEDDFLFFHFLHRAIEDDTTTEDLNRIIARWEIVLEGQESGYFNVCRALASDRSDDFEPAFESFIKTRQRQLKEYKESIGYDREMFAAEGKIFIEGLAVLRIAEMKGLPAVGEYKLVPDNSRILVGLTLPAPDSWRVL